MAKQNWEGLAIGTAISGAILTVGENVCAMDDESIIKNGRIVRSPDMENRVKLFQDWQEKNYGTVAVQANVEDTRLGVQEYVIEKLGVTAVELKWGQGAKDIGGEVKIRSLQRKLFSRSFHSHFCVQVTVCKEITLRFVTATTGACLVTLVCPGTARVSRAVMMPQPTLLSATHLLASLNQQRCVAMDPTTRA